MAETKNKNSKQDPKKDQKQTQKPAKKSDSKPSKKGVLKYFENITATCACGAEFKTGSTIEKIRVDICSHCHPLFTGEKRVMDTEGRIEKFKKKYNLK
ncbi:50S ribosomal protein L31 [Candidatus Margulisiibacteriota bacterium]